MQQTTTFIEELQDFLESDTWELIVDIVLKDIAPRRTSLLTSLNMTDTARIASVSRLAAYKDLFEAVYQKAGRKLPFAFLNAFTGEPYK